MKANKVTPGEVMTMLECAKLDIYCALREVTRSAIQQAPNIIHGPFKG